MIMNDIPQFVRDFLNYMETIKGKSQNTVNEYFYDIRTFLRWIKLCKSNTINSGASDIVFVSTLNNFDDAEFKQLNVNDVTLDDIRQIRLTDIYSYMSWLNRYKNNSPTARARKVASLRSMFKYLTDKASLIDYNPTSELESPKLGKKLPKYLSVDESKALLNSVDGESSERDFAIIILFLSCGMRLSELVGINIQDIRGETLTVIGKGNKERTIYLNSACIDAIEKYMRARPNNNVIDRSALFLSKRKKRISKQTVQHIIKKYLALAGLDTKKYSTHKLRHTAATMLYQLGKVDIRALQEILGHESISTTEIYTHIDKSQLRNAANSSPLANFKKS